MPPFPPSHRGQDNVRPDLMIDLSRRLAHNTYDKKSNPSGIVDLGSATNELMLGELQKWLSKNKRSDDKARYLKYNDTQCSPELPAAAAEFMNHAFLPRVLLTGSNILAANGVTALLDTLFFNVADGGDVVLVPTPSYGMFMHDVTTRNGLHLVGVPCDDITEARFRQHVRPGRPQPELINRLEFVAGEQRRMGRRVAALLIANPENPLGRCYTAEILWYLVKFCQREKLHFVVDEIYALSAGPNFTSVLSLDLRDALGNVHVLWGMSKDFGLGGLRVGFLATYNQRLYQTMRTLSMFNWISAFGGIVSTRLLSDRKFVMQRYRPMLYKMLYKRRKQLDDFLSSNLIGYTAPDAAFFVFIDLSSWLGEVTGNTDKEREIALAEYLMDHGVFLEPGQAFSSKIPGHFRLNYGAEETVFKIGLRRLAYALKKLDGGDKDSVTKKAKTSLKSLLCLK
ncbi:1-aminocyclopropane-1-carboxylate synthase-like protein 1 [Cytospora mali]|uniref:1-aminocyclopropane-1-carboxylate synthase-like protein 1 n=1 Tax=Cytospora mali TaxID=578113 RepID=A0A194WB94_CYTMA|nr:1-aminocyclopropane-1-carboxylate synthase-like protein 1 [Valsa mali]